MKRKDRSDNKHFSNLLGIFIILSMLNMQDTSLTPSNTSRYIGIERWEWTIFLKGSAETINNISRVEYILPKSFPKPIRQVNNIGSIEKPFAMTDSGWGRFEISIKAFLKSGGYQVFKHMLRLESMPTKEKLEMRPRYSLSALGNRQWEWNVFITGRPEVMEKVLLVKYSIPGSSTDMESLSERDVLERGSGNQCFALSGISSTSFQVKIRAYLKDGTYLDLQNQRINIIER